MNELRIPKERVAILIGKNGSVKKQFEDHAKLKINVNSDEGEVVLKGTDPINLYAMREVIHAIGRGFNPEIAQLLLKQDFVLEIINLEEKLDTKKEMIRLKGRIIGSEGKTRSLIEEHTDTNISVYGKTVSIIGMADDVTNARRAITMLLTGSPHATVYKWLEKRRKMKRYTNYGEDQSLFIKSDNEKRPKKEKKEKLQDLSSESEEPVSATEDFD